MPTEDRRITFTNDEVYKAVFALCTQKQIPTPPAGHVKTIDQTSGTNNIVLKLENPLDEADTELEYNRDFIAAALMIFCRGCGIPLPKNAQKSVLLKDAKLILRVQM